MELNEELVYDLVKIISQNAVAGFGFGTVLSLLGYAIKKVKSLFDIFTKGRG